MSLTLASAIYDPSAPVAPLEAYMFLSQSGTINVVGVLVDKYNKQTGNSFASTVGTGTAKTLTDFYGATLPADAVGVILSFSGAAYVALGAGTSGYVTDFQTNAARYGTVPSTVPQTYGRVNPLTYTGPLPVTGTVVVSSITGALPAGENYVGHVGATTARPSANFTRPNDTTAYASGDLVANSTTAGSVTPLSFTAARVSGGSGMIRKIKIASNRTSGVSAGTVPANASFRIHLYSSSPTVTNGDNGAWFSDSTAGYLGAFDVTMDRAFSDGFSGSGVPVTGSEMNFVATAQILYGLMEARAAYTPVANEIFTVTLEDLQN